MKKLSPTQVKVLRKLAEEGNHANFFDGLDAYWYLAFSWKTIRFSTMESIINAGLVDVIKNYFGDYEEATINDAGRAYLAELGEKG